MGKVISVVVILLCLALISVSYLIPKDLTFSDAVFAKCNESGAARSVISENKWLQWWPEKNSLAKPHNPLEFSYKGNTFLIGNKSHSAVEISITNKTDTIFTKLNVFNTGNDSVLLFWQGRIHSGFNPITKLIAYQKARVIKNDMHVLLQRLSVFLKNPDNIYGFHFFVTMSKDSTLVATKMYSASYPTTEEIYSSIERLRKYISDNRTKENSYPMLNVKDLETGGYETTVALPVNKELPGRGEIFFSRFIPWKGITAEVKGGVQTVNEALRQMSYYITDHQLVQMAIPHQSLITDRLLEPDTSKWSTKIYIPIP